MRQLMDKFFVEMIGNKIDELRGKGMSLPKIAMWLNDQGIYTITNKRWSESTITHVFHVYNHRIPGYKYTPKDKYPTLTFMVSTLLDNCLACSRHKLEDVLLILLVRVNPSTARHIVRLARVIRKDIDSEFPAQKLRERMLQWKLKDSALNAKLINEILIEIKELDDEIYS